MLAVVPSVRCSVRCDGSVNKNDGDTASSANIADTRRARANTVSRHVCLRLYGSRVSRGVHRNDRAGASDKVRRRRAENERLGLKSDAALTYRVMVLVVNRELSRSTDLPDDSRLSITWTIIPRPGCSTVLEFDPPDVTGSATYLCSSLRHNHVVMQERKLLQQKKKNSIRKGTKTL